MSYIPMSKWGKDHWSTLAYIETVMVDCQGFQVGTDARMRSNRRHWRVMQEECPCPNRIRMTQPSQSVVMDSVKHGTRLNDGTSVTDHDDWMCLQDMAQEGLFTCDVTGVQPGEVLQLSPKGWQLVSELRQYKANGGAFGTFSPRV